ncbi:MAG: hypothetical protein K6360_04045 [Deltaproteobacteria bacterium]
MHAPAFPKHLARFFSVNIRRRIRPIPVFVTMGICMWVGGTCLVSGTCRQTSIPLSPYRGAILDRSGVMLAGSIPEHVLVIHPTQMPPGKEWAKDMGTILGLDPDALLRSARSGRGPVTIAVNPGEGARERLESLGLDGARILTSYRRISPYRDLAGEIIGDVGEDGHGISGVEYIYDDLLGESGVMPSRTGPGNVILSLERGLQMEAEKGLQSALNTTQAARGCFIVMDVERGEILAMANAKPSDSPSAPQVSETLHKKNFAIQGEVDPFPIPLLIARSESLGCAPESDPSAYPRPPQDAWQWTVSPQGREIFSPWSAEEIEQIRILPGILGSLSRMGFGQTTGIDLEGEAAGRIPAHLEGTWSEPFTEGFSATPIQILRAFCALINRGKVVTPRITLTKHETSPSFWRLASDLGKAGPPITEKASIFLQQELSREHGPSIVYVSGRVPDTNTAAQFLALGFAPRHAPEIAYILVMDTIGDVSRISSILAGLHQTAYRGVGLAEARIQIAASLP